LARQNIFADHRIREPGLDGRVERHPVRLDAGGRVGRPDAVERVVGLLGLEGVLVHGELLGS